MIREANGRKTILAIAVALGAGLILAPVAQGILLGHWTFNGDNANDLTGNGHNGIPQGGFSYVNTPGGRGISLDGESHSVSPNVGSGVTIPAHADFDPTGIDALSIEVWVDVDVDDGGTGNNEWIVRRADSKFGIGYKIDGGLNRVTFQHNGGSGFETSGNMAGSTANIDVGFHHIVFTKPVVGDKWVHYVNGVDQGAAGGAAGWDDNGPGDVRIGWGGGNALTGIWDEVRIHDVGLSAADVLASFQVGPVIPEPGTLALFGIGLLAMNRFHRRHRG